MILKHKKHFSVVSIFIVLFAIITILQTGEEFTSQGNVLLKISGFLSPFNQLEKRSYFRDEVQSCKVTDNIQYISFLKDAKAATPLNL